jgi:hypothetical protein
MNMRGNVCNWQNRRLSLTSKKSLIELSHIWMEAALKEERHTLPERAPKAAAR